MSNDFQNNAFPELTIVRVSDCPACGSRKVFPAFEATEETRTRFRQLSEKKYSGELNGWEEKLSLNVLRCLNCDHHWHEEQPGQESLISMYAAAMRGRESRHISENIAMDNAIALQAHRLFTMAAGDLNKKPRLLEFGGGLGRWGTAFQAAGFSVTAYEPVSERAGSSEEDRFNVVNDMEELRGEKFDAINVEQVLEHVPDPVGELRQLREFCTDNTVLRITVPNFQKFATKNNPWIDYPYAGRMHILSPYEHLQGFSPMSLRKAFFRAGYKEISVTRLTRSRSGRVLARRLASSFLSRFRETAIYAVPELD